MHVCLSIPCMVLSYVRPHNNLSTCATHWLPATTSLCYFSQSSPSIFFTFLLAYQTNYKTAGEIKDFVVVAVVVVDNT